MRTVRFSTLWTLAAGLAAPGLASAQAAHEDLVQVQMRNVAFHVDSTIVLGIRFVRGELRRTAPGQAPWLDDKHSFVLGIDSARIGITPAALGGLLNRYTFAYPGSPLRKLTITLDRGQVVQHGLLHGISFTVVGDLTLTPEGALRLHPTSVKAVGIKVGGLMKLFGLHLQKLVNTDQARGVTIDGDDFILTPAQLLPPPRVAGRVVAVEVNDSEIVQTFGAERPLAAAPDPLTPPLPKAENYMFFRKGVLRFGKLTMNDTDLMIVDADPKDPFDFWLDRYNRQLVAGVSRNTVDHGLIVDMPDFRRIGGQAGGRSDGRAVGRSGGQAVRRSGRAVRRTGESS